MAEDVRFRTMDKDLKERIIKAGFDVVEVIQKNRFEKEYVFATHAEEIRKAGVAIPEIVKKEEKKKT